MKSCLSRAVFHFRCQRQSKATLLGLRTSSNVSGAAAQAATTAQAVAAVTTVHGAAAAPAAASKQKSYVRN
jgi:hypothetical protein